MRTDRIVEEIRRNADDIAKRAGGTLHGLFKTLIAEQRGKSRRLVRLGPKPRFAATGTNGH